MDPTKAVYNIFKTNRTQTRVPGHISLIPRSMTYYSDLPDFRFPETPTEQHVTFDGNFTWDNFAENLAGYIRSYVLRQMEERNEIRVINSVAASFSFDLPYSARVFASTICRPVRLTDSEEYNFLQSFSRITSLPEYNHIKLSRK